MIIAQNMSETLLYTFTLDSTKKLIWLQLTVGGGGGGGGGLKKIGQDAYLPEKKSCPTLIQLKMDHLISVIVLNKWDHHALLNLASPSGEKEGNVLYNDN